MNHPQFLLTYSFRPECNLTKPVSPSKRVSDLCQSRAACFNLHKVFTAFPHTIVPLLRIAGLSTNNFIQYPIQHGTLYIHVPCLSRTATIDNNARRVAELPTGAHVPKTSISSSWELPLAAYRALHCRVSPVGPLFILKAVRN